MLHLDGRHDSLLAPDRRGVEILFEDFYQNLRHVLACADRQMVSDESIPQYLEFLRGTLDKLRSAQKKRDEWRAYRHAHAEAIRERLPTPPAPSDDPRSPPASQA
jgi:hypothetical protein